MSGRIPARLRGFVAAAALTLPIVGLSRLPYSPPGSDAAVLRLSWRMSVTAREECRQRTEAELEALPVHMRTPEVCTRDRASYSLVTRVGHGAPDTVALVRGGVKGDRPLFVLEERRLAAGRHRVAVALLRTNGGATSEVLAELDTAVVLTPGAVHLVTLDADASRLVVRSPGGVR